MGPSAGCDRQQGTQGGRANVAHGTRKRGAHFLAEDATQASALESSTTTPVASAVGRGASSEALAFSGG